MAIFQDKLPEARRPGPELAAVLHRLGRGVAVDLRPRRRVAAGARDAAVEGQRPVRLQRRGLPLQRHLLSAPRRDPPRTTCTRRARSCAALASSSGPRTRRTRRPGTSRPDAPLEQRPYGGTIKVGYPYNTITYKYDRNTNTYLRSVTGETKQTDAADKTRIAPKNVIVMRMRFGPLNDGHPGLRGSRPTIVGSGPAWISTNGRTIKGPGRRPRSPSRPSSTTRTASEVTLTVGPDLRPGPDHEHVELHGLTFKAGSDTPPATSRSAALAPAPGRAEPCEP